MPSRLILLLAIIAWNAVMPNWLRAAAPSRPARPATNVLFIVADDLNTLLGCYGDPLAKTPHIDALAARGLVFERAYCTCPLCGPSRNSFLTGLHPNTTGIFANQQIFRQTIPAHPSLPQLFRRHGGFAARVGKLYHYNVPSSIGTAGHDDPASWEATFNPAGVDRLEEEPRIFTLVPGQFGGTLSWYASPEPDERHTDGILARQAEQVLAMCATDRSRPFFLGVAFFRPHLPFVAPREPYFAMHPREKMPVVAGVTEDQADLPAAAKGRGWAITQVVRGGGKNRPTVTRDASSDDPRYVGYSLRTPRWRYTEWDEGRKGHELYDHDTDPRELKNLADDPAHAIDRTAMAARLREAIAATLPPGGVVPDVQPGTWAPVLIGE